MKKSIISLCAIFALLSSCEGDKNVDNGYAKPPTIDEITIAPLGSTAREVVAGYYARIDAGFTAGDNPLSTLKFVVTSGSAMVASETTYLKEGQTTDSYEFAVPFTKNLNDNTYFDVLLMLEDSKENQAEARLSNEDNIKIMRPTFGDKLYLVNNSDNTVTEMSKAADSNYEYVAVGNFSNSISFRVAEKLTSDNEIDYDGFVWAADEGVALKTVANNTPLPATISEPDAGSITRISFDVFTFLYSYELAEKDAMYINSVKLVQDAVYGNYKSASIELTQDAVIQFTNFDVDIEKLINPEFFEYVSPTTAKFLGLTGTYDLHMQDGNGYIFIEEKDATDGVWLMSNNLAFPNYGYGTEYKTATSWSWETPDKYVSFRKVSGNIYSGTTFVGGWISGYFFSSKSSTMPGGGVAASRRLDTENYTFTSFPDGLFKAHDDPAADQIGRIIIGAGFKANNVYRFTIDTSAKTVHAEQIGIETVKDIPLSSGASYAGYQSASISLVQDEVVEFKNFKNLRNQLYPEFFEYVSDTKAKFLGQTGTYELHLHETDGYIFVDQKDAAAGIWMIWNATGFPNYGYHAEYKSASGFAWSWNAPKNHLFFRKVSEDVFSGSVYCSGYMSGFFVTRRDAPMPPNQSGQQTYRLPLTYDEWTLTTNVPEEDGTHPMTIGLAGGGDIDRFLHDVAVNGGNLGKYRWRVTVTMSTKNVHFERLAD